MSHLNFPLTERPYKNVFWYSSTTTFTLKNLKNHLVTLIHNYPVQPHVTIVSKQSV